MITLRFRARVRVSAEASEQPVVPDVAVLSTEQGQAEKVRDVGEETKRMPFNARPTMRDEPRIATETVRGPKELYIDTSVVLAQQERKKERRGGIR